MVLPKMKEPSKSVNSFYEILHIRATQQPEAIAYRFHKNDPNDTESLTYRCILEKTNSLIKDVSARIEPGSRVVISMPSCQEFVIAFLACQALGAISVPVPPPTRKRVDERLERILIDAQASVVLTLDNIARDIIDVDKSGLKHLELISVDCIKEDSKTSSDLSRSIDVDDLTFLQYTSGSTGDPKGVAISHRNLLHNSSLIYQQCHPDVDNIGVTWLPLFHDMGLIGGMLQPLYAGFPVTIMQPAAFLMKPLEWLRLVSDLRATMTPCPNFALELCADKATPETLEGIDLSSLQVLLCGAEPIQTNTLDRFSSVFACTGFDSSALTPSYGLAEATLIVSGKQQGESFRSKNYERESVATPGERVVEADGSGALPIVSCGRAVQNMAVVHPTSGEELADGCVGEIWVAGDSVAKGYWQRPELTAKVFHNHIPGRTTDNVFLRTGDLGFVSQGELFVTGRLKDLIIIRGKNVYPQDVERLASSVDTGLAVGVAAAFTAPMNKIQQLVVVIEVTRRGLKAFSDSSYSAKVIGEINRVVAEECGVTPAELCLIKPNQLRRTSSGKVRRVENRKAWLADELKVVHRWKLIEPSTSENEDNIVLLESKDDIESWLVSRLAERCSIDARDVALDQPFVTFGLDSLAALELVQSLQKRLPDGVQIDYTVLWDYPTIAAMVDYLSSTENINTNNPPSITEQDLDPDDEIAKLKALLA